MEFYLHNKDDRKSRTSVNLATTFKRDDINYIVYYNTQVEKSMIDIYIGKISYGDECLVINKIDQDKQADFLEIIKKVLSGESPESEFNDYDNIIDTATIVLDTVQKIQIPTVSLENLKNYHKIEFVTKKEENKSETNETSEQNESNELNETSEPNEITETNFKYEEENVISTSDDNKVENENIDSNADAKEEITNVESSNNETSANYIHSDDRLTNLDNLLNEKEEKNKDKKKKSEKTPAIRPSILILLILVVVGSALLFYFGTLA